MKPLFYVIFIWPLIGSSMAAETIPNTICSRWLGNSPSRPTFDLELNHEEELLRTQTFDLKVNGLYYGHESFLRLMLSRYHWARVFGVKKVGAMQDAKSYRFLSPLQIEKVPFLGVEPLGWEREDVHISHSGRAELEVPRYTSSKPREKDLDVENLGLKYIFFYNYNVNFSLSGGTSVTTLNFIGRRIERHFTYDTEDRRLEKAGLSVTFKQRFADSEFREFKQSTLVLRFGPTEQRKYLRYRLPGLLSPAQTPSLILKIAETSPPLRQALPASSKLRLTKTQHLNRFALPIVLWTSRNTSIRVGKITLDQILADGPSSSTENAAYSVRFEVIPSLVSADLFAEFLLDFSNTFREEIVGSQADSSSPTEL